MVDCPHRALAAACSAPSGHVPNPVPDVVPQPEPRTPPPEQPPEIIEPSLPDEHPPVRDPVGPGDLVWLRRLH